MDIAGDTQVEAEANDGLLSGKNSDGSSHRDIPHILNESNLEGDVSKIGGL